jgi:hypothetical protein
MAWAINFACPAWSPRAGKEETIRITLGPAGGRLFAAGPPQPCRARAVRISALVFAKVGFADFLAPEQVVPGVLQHDLPGLDHVAAMGHLQGEQRVLLDQ